MRFRRASVLPAIALASMLMLSACGPQSDDRAPEGATSAASEAPAEAPAEEPAADAPATAFVSMNCATMEVTGSDAPPADATTVGDVSAAFASDGVPTLTVAVANAPAVELGIADIVEGDGAEVQAGDTVTVNYCGAGQVGLGVFDSSWSRGEPISFPLDGLIPGWQEGIPGMKVGGKRLLVIPGALGYGEQGAPGIAPDETLAFVIELLDVAS